MRDLRSFIVSAVLAVASAGVATAQPGYGYYSEPQYDPLDAAGFSLFVGKAHEDNGFAAPYEVRQAVGDVRFDLSCSEPRQGGAIKNFERDRYVRAYIGVSELPRHAVVNTIVGASLNRAYRDCPTYWHDVNLVEVYGPSSQLLLQASDYTGVFQKWGKFTDVRAERAAAAERQRQDAANAAARAQRDAELRRALAERRAAEQRAAAAFWFWVQVGLAGVALLFVWSKREAIAYWFYSLTPHPATDMVQRTVSGRGDIDGELFAEIMREVSGGRAEKRARADQAERLAAMARAAAEWRTEQLKRERDKAVEDTAFIRAQEELRRAAEEHELAKARLDALRKWKDRNAR